MSVMTQRYVAVRLLRIAAAAALYIFTNIAIVPMANAPLDIAVWASFAGTIVCVVAMAWIVVTERLDRHYTRFLNFLDNGY